ncbi:UvrD-helicase domain-containing protein [Stackebrandtia albiflava]|uniref:UvrD-helicase domain-containing protein n=1 Tax=Stackebrandtia albiflava TaxID=406432 RepID=UPI0011BFD238|nr:UvrD-helicase domain-containing protein [Stackebrandtia albiflava]
MFIHPTALKQMNRMPHGLRVKCDKAIAHFERDRSHPGLQFKQLKSSPHYSIRIDQDYRGILQRTKGETFLLIAVSARQSVYDNLPEDVATDVNRVTGEFEVIPLDDVEKVAAAEPRADAAIAGTQVPPPLFDGFTDKELVDLGVAPVLMPSVREIRTETGLFRLVDVIPQHSANVLIELATGTSIDDVYEKITAPRVTTDVDVTDIDSAVERTIGTAVRSDDPAVKAMLEGDFEAWRLFLHPSQRALVESDHRGPVKVSGGPGTGKTVVALHRAARLARAAEPDDRILLTSYSANLAADLEDKLRGILPRELAGRVEVANVDKITRRIAFAGLRPAPQIADTQQQRDHWQTVLDAAGETEFDVPFCIDEWQHVVSAQMINAQHEYESAPRIGRIRRMSRAQRARYWQLLTAFKKRLQDEGQWTFEQVQLRAALSEEMRRMMEPARYQHVIVDEAQDLTAAHWRLLRALVEPGANDLFAVGDPHQRIFAQPVTLSSLGINVKGRSRRLEISYRSTRQILATATSVMAGSTVDDLDGGIDDLTRYRAIVSGTDPRFVATDSTDTELDAIVAQIKEWDHVDRTAIAVCAPYTHQAKRLAAQLSAAGIPTERLGKTPPTEPDAIHVATMARLKGLEYRCIVICGVNADQFPRGFATELADADPTAYQAAMQRERALLFVAATRARDALTFVWHGEPTEFLRSRLREGQRYRASRKGHPSSATGSRMDSPGDVCHGEP